MGVQDPETAGLVVRSATWLTNAERQIRQCSKRVAFYAEWPRFRDAIGGAGFRYDHYTWADVDNMHPSQAPVAFFEQAHHRDKERRQGLVGDPTTNDNAEDANMCTHGWLHHGVCRCHPCWTGDACDTAAEQGPGEFQAFEALVADGSSQILAINGCRLPTDEMNQLSRIKLVKLDASGDGRCICDSPPSSHFKSLPRHVPYAHTDQRLEFNFVVPQGAEGRYAVCLCEGIACADGAGQKESLQMWRNLGETSIYRTVAQGRAAGLQFQPVESMDRSAGMSQLSVAHASSFLELAAAPKAQLSSKLQDSDEGGVEGTRLPVDGGTRDVARIGPGGRNSSSEGTQGKPIVDHHESADVAEREYDGNATRGLTTGGRLAVIPPSSFVQSGEMSKLAGSSGLAHASEDESQQDFGIVNAERSEVTGAFSPSSPAASAQRPSRHVLPPPLVVSAAVTVVGSLEEDVPKARRWPLLFTLREGRTSFIKACHVTRICDNATIPDDAAASLRYSPWPPAFGLGAGSGLPMLTHGFTLPSPAVLPPLVASLLALAIATWIGVHGCEYCGCGRPASGSDQDRASTLGRLDAKQQ
mmetsp:Transcript_117288/g.336481  ORF Transcript_117288/g.336481 Transcript_117288/m.336481 type:complete len:585 (-) Transcript_117288:55-1809(-)